MLIELSYFPFYKNKFCFSARLLFFSYSQQLEEPSKIGFGGVPLKQHIGENARKLVKTGAKRALDFLAHAHMHNAFILSSSHANQGSCR